MSLPPLCTFILVILHQHITPRLSLHVSQHYRRGFPGDVNLNILSMHPQRWEYPYLGDDKLFQSPECPVTWSTIYSLASACYMRTSSLE